MRGRKLGRGLDVLLDRARARKKQPEDTRDEAPGKAGPEEAGGRVGAAAAAAPATPEGGPATPGGDGDGILHVAVAAIEVNPSQPRRAFDRKELESLAASISREGVLQPVLVRRRGEGFQLVAGERRLRAAREAGLETIPAIPLAVGDDRLLELALIENVHREDLNPIETARAFESLLELKKWTQETLARNLGLSRSVVSNTLRLLDLPENIQRALERGQIQVGHAKILLSVTGAREQQELFEKIAEDRLSVRELELVREAIPPPAASAPTEEPKRRKRRRKAGLSGKPAGTVRLEEELTEALGTRVTILEKKGRGVLRIEFYSPDDFEHLRQLLLAGGSKS